MPNNILDGLSLVDPTGRFILATTVTTLALGIGANLLVRGGYARLEADLEENVGARGRFSHPVLDAIFRDGEAAGRRSAEPNTQAIVEAHFQSDLKSLLLAERFVRAATGLVIILGLLGTFYGLTSSIGRLVQLVAGDTGGVADVTQGVTTGLTQALSGMAVAFSNSLLGIVAAVILTIVNVFSNVTDRRVALMIRVETCLDRVLSERSPPPPNTVVRAHADGLDRSVAGFDDAVGRLETVVERFESALRDFSASTRDFTEFNAHLKDNIQRMSLSFGDLGDTLRGQIHALKRGNGQGQ
jgi:hypothetical protein